MSDSPTPYGASPLFFGSDAQRPTERREPPPPGITVTNQEHGATHRRDAVLASSCRHTLARDRPTRVIMLIDQLEPGGAQRQFCLLATTLRRAGLVVEVLVFREDNFFADGVLDTDAIPLSKLQFRNLLHLYFVVRRAVRARRPDIVIGFLPWPSLLLELSGLPRRTFKILVSLRNLDLSPPAPKRFLRYFFHRYADVVVSNSYAQRDRMRTIAPRIAKRTIVIINGLDTALFNCRSASEKPSSTYLKVLVLARFAPQKNVVRFIKAVDLVLSRHPAVRLEIDWYGKRPRTPAVPSTRWGRRHTSRLVEYYAKVEEALLDRSLGHRFRLHGPHTDVRALYARADVLCLPSLYEGCSNVIGEAMACGLPVLASRVGDNGRLIEEGRNGFLFDPLSVDDMASAIVNFARLATEDRRRMGSEGRKMAQELLSLTVFASRYLTLVRSLVGDSRDSRS